MSAYRTCALLLTALVSGCAGGQCCHEGKLVARYRPRGMREMAQVPYPAAYSLHRCRTPGTGQLTTDGWYDLGGEPWTWLRMRRGEWVGFQKGEDGELLAVAGAEKIPLPPGCYCWHITPETEYRGLKLAGHQAQGALAAAVSVPLRVAGEILFVVVLGI